MKINVVVLGLFLLSVNVFSQINLFYYDDRIAGGLGRRSYVINECAELPNTLEEYRKVNRNPSSGDFFILDGKLLFKARLEDATITYMKVPFDATTGVLEGERMVLDLHKDASTFEFINDFFMEDRQRHFEAIRDFRNKGFVCSASTLEDSGVSFVRQFATLWRSFIR